MLGLRKMSVIFIPSVYAFIVDAWV